MFFKTLILLIVASYSVTETANTANVSGTNYYGWGELTASVNLGSELPVTVGNYTITTVIAWANTRLTFGLRGNYSEFPDDLSWIDDLYTYDRATLSSWTRSYDPSLNITYWSITYTGVGGNPPPQQPYQNGIDYSPVISFNQQELEVRTFHDKEYDARRRPYTQNIGEQIIYKYDFSRLATERGTSVSSATWAVVEGDATIASTSVASSIAQATISKTNSGTALIKLTATQADGNDRIKYLMIKALDPRGYTSDYN